MGPLIEGLLNMISHEPWDPLAVCATCRMSQEVYDKVAKAAKSKLNHAMKKSRPASEH